jgi:hypothetical protein
LPLETSVISHIFLNLSYLSSISLWFLSLPHILTHTQISFCLSIYHYTASPQLPLILLPRNWDPHMYVCVSALLTHKRFSFPICSCVFWILMILAFLKMNFIHWLASVLILISSISVAYGHLALSFSLSEHFSTLVSYCIYRPVCAHFCAALFHWCSWMVQ